jgi:hypothetical protein
MPARTRSPVAMATASCCDDRGEGRPGRPFRWPRAEVRCASASGDPYTPTPPSHSVVSSNFTSLFFSVSNFASR